MPKQRRTKGETTKEPRAAGSKRHGAADRKGIDMTETSAAREPQTYDLTAKDYSFQPRGDGGRKGHIAAWSGRKPRAGDFLILRNGRATTRYRVLDVDLCMNVDPPTMWMADLEFAPRTNA